MKELDPLIHSPLRLAILSMLAGGEEADFMNIKLQTGATTGNISVQITKLQEAGYISVEKTFAGRRPRTVCRITDTGREAFASYIEALKTYISPVESTPATAADMQPGMLTSQ